MNDILKKLMTKYIRCVNAIVVVSIYIVISSILFLGFERYDIPQIMEASRWIGVLGLKINLEVRFLGTFVAMLMNCTVAGILYLLSRKCKQGDLRYYVAVEVIFVLDSLASVFNFDILSFILHLAVLVYLLYGHYIYMKLIVEHNKYKKNKNKEEE